MRKKYIKYSLILMGILFGCDHSLDKINPNNVAVTDYFKNDGQLQKAANAMYATAQSSGMVAREWFFVHDLRSDDCKSNGGSLEAARAQLLTGNNDYANPVAESLWQACYIIIGRANKIIEVAPSVTATDIDVHNRIVAEAKFFRAWAYFELATIWGAVPMPLEPVKSMTDYYPKSTAAAVLAQVVKDLTEAQDDLFATYADSDKGRATKAAAQAMLARVYMFQGNFTGARTELLKIVNSNLYGLMDEYMDNFYSETEYNKESIFEIGFADNSNFGWGSNSGDALDQVESTIRNQEYSPIAWRNLVPSDSLIAEFEYGTLTGDNMIDPRFHKSFYVSGDTYNYDADTLTDNQQGGSGSAWSNFHGTTMKISWRKYTLIYRSNAAYQPGGINQRIIRYAEVLLMLAECENELNNSADAIAYLNQIRNRPSVSMDNYPTSKYPCSSQSEIFKAVMHEKRVEMACEEVRNRDILRWRIHGKLATDPISYVAASPSKALLPIPQSEISANPLVSQ